LLKGDAMSVLGFFFLLFAVALAVRVVRKVKVAQVVVEAKAKPVADPVEELFLQSVAEAEAKAADPVEVFCRRQRLAKAAAASKAIQAAVAVAEIGTVVGPTAESVSMTESVGVAVLEEAWPELRSDQASPTGRFPVDSSEAADAEIAAAEAYEAYEFEQKCSRLERLAKELGLADALSAIKLARTQQSESQLDRALRYVEKELQKRQRAEKKSAAKAEADAKAEEHRQRFFKGAPNAVQAIEDRVAWAFPQSVAELVRQQIGLDTIQERIAKDRTEVGVNQAKFLLTGTNRSLVKSCLDSAEGMIRDCGEKSSDLAYAHDELSGMLDRCVKGKPAASDLPLIPKKEKGRKPKTQACLTFRAALLARRAYQIGETLRDIEDASSDIQAIAKLNSDTSKFSERLSSLEQTFRKAWVGYIPKEGENDLFEVVWAKAQELHRDLDFRMDRLYEKSQSKPAPVKTPFQEKSREGKKQEALPSSSSAVAVLLPRVIKHLQQKDKKMNCTGCGRFIPAKDQSRALNAEGKCKACRKKR